MGDKMTKYLFIVNPTAGKGKALKLIPKIESFFKENDYKITITQRIGHGEEIARNALDNGFTHIISVGGDGTVFEVLNGVKEKGLILGILPAGTGNDFARTIQLPKDINSIFHRILKGKTKRIDIGKINNKYFINVVSIGIDAEIVKETEKIKGFVPKSMAYILGVFFTLAKYKHKRVEIFIDGKSYRRDIQLIAIGNGKYYGGGMKITPMAEVDDGYFDICIVNKISKLKLAALLPTVFKGQHTRIKDVQILRGKDVKVLSQEPLLINADGNIIGTTPANLVIESISQDIII